MQSAVAHIVVHKSNGILMDCWGLEKRGKHQVHQNQERLPGEGELSAKLHYTEERKLAGVGQGISSKAIS